MGTAGAPKWENHVKSQRVWVVNGTACSWEAIIGKAGLLRGMAARGAHRTVCRFRGWHHLQLRHPIQFTTCCTAPPLRPGPSVHVPLMALGGCAQTVAQGETLRSFVWFTHLSTVSMSYGSRPGEGGTQVDHACASSPHRPPHGPRRPQVHPNDLTGPWGEVPSLRCRRHHQAQSRPRSGLSGP